MRRRLARTIHDWSITAVTAVGKRVPAVLDLARRIVLAYRARRYNRLAASIAVEPTMALFNSYGGRSYSCSPRSIYRRMLTDERFADYEFVWVLRENVARALHARGGYDVRGLSDTGAKVPADVDLDRNVGAQSLAELRRAVIVVYHSREHYRALARAATWFTNSIMPDHVRPREGQMYVQAWHGTPLKRLGHDVTANVHAVYTVRGIHERYGREGARSTVMVAPSQFVAEKYVSAFALDVSGRQDIVVVTGYPRNDDLHEPDSAHTAAIKDRLGVPPGNKAVLYAPTWRDDEHATGVGFTHRVAADFDRVRSELGDGWTILFRAHYLIANEFDFERHGGFVIDVSAVSEINDLYLVSDILVTDYSSVFFDYANLGRPIIFYLYDLDRYAGTVRGFYLSLDELPGPIARTDDELIEALRDAGRTDWRPDDRYRAFRDRFTYLDDGHASERVLEHVFAGRTATVAGDTRERAR